jgi:N-acyl-D-amino-acid deacylase
MMNRESRPATDVDLVIRGGTIFDGDGGEPWVGDIAVRGDRIAALGDVPLRGATIEIDGDGLAAAPGFINMMSWAVESLIEDGRSQSDIRQGVTLEVMGEGFSMGPLNADMRLELEDRGIWKDPDRFPYPVEWTTLCGYLGWLEERGISTNVSSFVGAGTLRVHEVGYDDRPATADELTRMGSLLRQEMEGGALGVASALIYPPSSYADTAELIALARVAAEHGGLYASHMRSEGATLLEALRELIAIAREANVRAEVYHLKAAGRGHWDKLGAAIELIEAARGEGLAVTADMYPYDFAGTGLTACIPPWAHDGGVDALLTRLRDADDRARIREEMTTPSDAWENAYLDAGPDGIMLSGSLAPAIGPLQGSTLTEVAARRGTGPEDTLMDLVVENGGGVQAMYFDMLESNVRRQIPLPWVSFCSDAESLAPEGRFLTMGVHPRAYGAFARVLGRYVRDEALLPLQEAVRKMTSLPADNLRLEDRGRLRVGGYADIAVFDPAAIADHATPSDPHRFATGMVHVIVNGEPVLLDGEHTGATPGRFVRGPGARRSDDRNGS